MKSEPNLLKDLLHLQTVHGESATLEQVINAIKGKRIYTCPQCHGEGTMNVVERVPYPSGLPDSGWVPDKFETRQKRCSLCEGYGCTEVEYVPKMIQSGWVGK